MQGKAKSKAFVNNLNGDDRTTCTNCGKKMTPKLWHYSPFLGKVRYMKTQHLCPYCGSCQYESGGGLSLYGKLILIATGVILFLSILMSVFPKAFASISDKALQMQENQKASYGKRAP